MVLIQTLQYYLFLLLLQFVIQRSLSEFWIWVLPITFVSSGSDSLVLENLMEAWCRSARDTHARLKK